MSAGIPFFEKFRIFICLDGCIVCNSQIFTRPNKCNIYCKNDFVCSGAAAGCIKCGKWFTSYIYNL